MTKADYAKTFVPASIAVFLALQKGWGFWLLILLPLFAATALHDIVRMVRRPDERKRRGIRLAVWAAALALIGAVQSYWSAASRDDADMAVKAVLEHKTRTGSFPASLKEAGLDDQALADEWTLRYAVREGKPVLSYPASFMPLTNYEYDFEAQGWRKNAY